MKQLRVFGAVAFILVIVSFAVHMVLPIFVAGIDGVEKELVEAVILATFAAPAVFFIIMRPRMNSRMKAEREFARLNRALEAEIASHQEIENILRNREEELRRHADEIEYNQSFIETHAAEMVALAEQISAQKTDIEESKRLSDYTANHDLLTGLPNRRNFQNRLADAITQAETQGGQVGLIFIDLDKFKSVNDKMGHEQGDALLQDVAGRLRAALQPGHVAARLGGDEFAVIVSAPAGLRDELNGLGQKISAALEIDVEKAGDVIHVGASLGVAIFPEDGSNPTDILRHADTAMYAAKTEKTPRVLFYSNLAKAS